LGPPPEGKRRSGVSAPGQEGKRFGGGHRQTIDEEERVPVQDDKDSDSDAELVIEVRRRHNLFQLLSFWNLLTDVFVQGPPGSSAVGSA
jgi:hypothetical protein